jgi:hypothetical protein
MDRVQLLGLVSGGAKRVMEIELVALAVVKLDV